MSMHIPQSSPFGHILTGLFLAACSYLLFDILYKLKLHPLHSFPGPRWWATTSLFRHYYAIKGSLDLILPDLHQKYGDVVRISPNELSFIDERAWSDIYARPKQPLAKDPAWYNAIKTIDQAHSINNAPFAKHIAMRRQLAHSFSEKALREQESLIGSHVNSLIDKLHRFAANQDAVDLVRWYNFTSFDVISDLALGESFNCLGVSKYHAWVESLFKSVKIGPFLRAMSANIDVGKVIKLLVPTHVQQARARHQENIRQQVQKCLAKDMSSERRDFMSYILQEESPGKEPTNEAELTANCMFLVVAGSETVATTLSGLTFNLLTNPKYQMDIVQEIRGVFSNEDQITFKSSSTQLPFTKACIQETLRMYPPAAVAFPRKTPPNDCVTIAGHEIPPSTTVGVHTLSAHLDPRSFHEALVFRPERWLARSVKDPQSPFFSDRRGACQAFGVGHQSCLGRSLALSEITLVLAKVLWNFDLELCEESRSWRQEQRSFIIWEKGPLMCRLSARTDVVRN